VETYAIYRTWYRICCFRRVQSPLVQTVETRKCPQPVNILLHAIRLRFGSPRGLRDGSMVARFLGLRVRIPPGIRLSVCRVLSARCLCDVPSTRMEELYRVLYVLSVVWELQQ